MHFLLFYEFTPDYLERRPEFRAAHLQLAWASQKRGELVLGGALADPVDGAVLLFSAQSDGQVRSFVDEDPYVKAGLVKRWYIRPWTTVVGDSAVMPVHPSLP